MTVAAKKQLARLHNLKQILIILRQGKHDVTLFPWAPLFHPFSSLYIFECCAVCPLKCSRPAIQVYNTLCKVTGRLLLKILQHNIKTPVRTKSFLCRSLYVLCYMFYIICFIIIYANNYFCLYEDKKSASLPVASFNISVLGRYTTLK